MFGFGDFLSYIVILYGGLLLMKAAIYVVKKVGLESHQQINNILV
jgi:hypothetical protein